jgi:ATP-dependent Zn protease
MISIVQNTFLDQQQYRSHEDYGPEMAGKVTTAMLGFLEEAFAKATEILHNNEDLLKHCAAKLLIDETFNENKMEEIKNKLKK